MYRQSLYYIMENYSKQLIDRRISLAIDDVQELRKLLPMDNLEDSVHIMLNNIEIALDLNDNESDLWSYYKEGNFAHLNQ
jgi:hypothetical protein